MEKKYKIKYLPLFYNDLERIVDYELENEIVADNFVDELEKEINKRAYSPKSYEKYISRKNRSNTYFRIYVKNYTVFYTVNDETMEIRRILNSRRNFGKLI